MKKLVLCSCVHSGYITGMIMATATRIVQTTLTLTTTCRMVASRSGRRWDSSTATQHLKLIRTVGRDDLSHSMRGQRLHGNNDDSDCDTEIIIATLQETAVELSIGNGGGGQSTPTKATIVALATVSCEVEVMLQPVMPTTATSQNHSTR